MATNYIAREEADFQLRYLLLMILSFANITLTRHLDLAIHNMAMNFTNLY